MADMNYTIIVLGAWLTLCIVYYYLPVYGGVHWFRGPISNIGDRDADDTNLEGEDSEKVSLSDERKSVVVSSRVCE